MKPEWRTLKSVVGSDWIETEFETLPKRRLYYTNKRQIGPGSIPRLRQIVRLCDEDRALLERIEAKLDLLAGQVKRSQRDR